MVKLRLLVILSTLLIVGAIAAVAILYAKGYRIESENDSVTISPKGLLVANSEPTGAQVYVDGKLQTATNNTVSLSPGSHEVKVTKEGFLPWQKSIQIEQEVVTQVNAYLLPSAPSLTALSFSGVINPKVSPDSTKIAYAVSKGTENQDKGGLWMYDTTNLPLGFSRDPKQITDADLVNFDWEWSPDARELLVSTKSASYLLPVSTTTSARNLVNIDSQVEKIRLQWSKDKTKKTEAQLANLNPEIANIFKESAKNISFSYDETKILYVATSSATVPSDLVKKLPGSSTQKESRLLTPNNSYVYDIKEDKNFLVDESKSSVYWIPNSLNVLIPEKDKISIVDYDGTNKTVVYTGSYIYPYAFPTTSTSKMVILTSFGATGTMPNLYWLSLK